MTEPKPGLSGLHQWALWKVLLLAVGTFVLVGLISGVLAGFSFGLYAAVTKTEMDLSTPYLRLSAGLLSGGLLFGTSYWIAPRIGVGTRQTALALGNWAVVPALLLGAGAFAINVIVYSIFLNIGSDAPINNSLLVVIGPAVFLSVPLVVFVAPVAEELFFRGWVYSGLVAKLNNPWTAIALTSLSWVAVHYSLGWHTMFVLIIPGVIFGWLRHKYQSVYPAIVAHSLMNLGVVLLYGTS